MAKSIISNERECVICRSEYNLHKHHIYGGSRRKNSEKYGCWIYLCAYHHNMSDHGIHFNSNLELKAKAICQHKFEAKHSHEEFMAVFGRDYLNRYMEGRA